MIWETGLGQVDYFYSRKEVDPKPDWNHRKVLVEVHDSLYSKPLMSGIKAIKHRNAISPDLGNTS